MASAGGEHTLYRNADGSLFSAGACGLGWCRLQDLNSDLFRWRPVPLPEPVRLMHASYYHNLAVGASTGQLYSWGCGTFVEGGLDGVIPALGPGVSSDQGELPASVPLPVSNKDETIAGVSGGAYHSIVWMSPSDTILTFGAGQLGQLGRSITKTDASGLPVDPIPAPAEGLPISEKVASIGAGFYNTFAACKSGSLFCAGENQNQQCGQGPLNLHSLTEVKEVEDVEQVEGGYCHTLIKTYAGKVLSLGCGDDGQRGDARPADDEETRPVVNPVNLPVKATQVAAGANHSAILGTDGIAYTFGANDVGQCGVPSDRDPDDEDDEGGGPVFGPRPVPLPKNAGKVVRVSAGYAHTVLTTESGKIYVFGQNDSGQLGLTYENISNPESHTKPVESSSMMASNPIRKPSSN
jgi:alpha-tubulin suppressor-like RCC1 family protein